MDHFICNRVIDDVSNDLIEVKSEVDSVACDGLYLAGAPRGGGRQLETDAASEGVEELMDNG